jgi:hypothetical protein
VESAISVAALDKVAGETDFGETPTVSVDPSLVATINEIGARVLAEVTTDNDTAEITETSDDTLETASPFLGSLVQLDLLPEPETDYEVAEVWEPESLLPAQTIDPVAEKTAEKTTDGTLWAKRRQPEIKESVVLRAKEK